MKSRIRTRTAAPALPRNVRDLIQAPAQAMGLSLEVWNGPGRATDRLHLSSACADCESREPRTFDRCRKRRSYLARPEARVPQEFSETCPFDQRLTRVAVAEGETVLFGFGYRAESSDADHGADADVVSFLQDAHLMLREPIENLPQLQSLSRARGNGQGIDLLRSGSMALPATPTASDNQALLEQWRVVLRADIACAWMQAQGTLLVSQAPSRTLPVEVRTSLDLLARRLAEELQSSPQEMRSTTLPPRHPVAQLLGEDVHVACLRLGRDADIQGMLCALRAGAFPAYGETESQLIHSLAREMSLRWSNGDLAQGLERFLVNTVKTLVSAIEAKDSYTSGHSERVNIISMLLGNELDLDLADLESLYWAALLHDVGKIGMPEAILNKPSPLGEDEFRIVQEHPERGWRMLHAVPELARAAEGIRHHHERWDGGGYPQGLTGQDIPILSRIICVADAFDAIVSNRSYRKGQSPTRAVELIVACAGEQFDPDVVAALERLLPLLEKHRWVLMSGRKTSLHYG